MLTQYFVSHVHVRFCFSLPLIFTLLAASISHCLTAALNFHVFLPTNSSLLFSITRSSSFSVIHVSVMPVVRTDGRSVYGHVITKFSRMGSLPHFFTHGAPLRALRARELRDDVTCPFKASGLFTSIITHEDINFISVTSHERRVLVGYPERRNSTQRYRE